jgi:hypothetical protein
MSRLGEMTAYRLEEIHGIPLCGTLRSSASVASRPEAAGGTSGKTVCFMVKSGHSIDLWSNFARLDARNYMQI